MVNDRLAVATTRNFAQYAVGFTVYPKPPAGIARFRFGEPSHENPTSFSPHVREASKASAKGGNDQVQLIIRQSDSVMLHGAYGTIVPRIQASGFFWLLGRP